MPTYHSYDPATGHGLKHDPFKAIVAPRPIGWISSVSTDGVVNLAPYSFFNGFCSRPPIVGFGSEGWKDSITNIEATGAFVCNLATRPLAEAMNVTSGMYAHGTDELALAGLTPVASTKVKAPRVGESPAAMECRLLDIVRLKDVDGAPLQASLVLGQVVAVHIDTAYLTDGLFDIVKAQSIARCGYASHYAQVTELFDMRRPQT